MRKSVSNGTKICPPPKNCKLVEFSWKIICVLSSFQRKQKKYLEALKKLFFEIHKMHSKPTCANVAMVEKSFLKKNNFVFTEKMF